VGGVSVDQHVERCEYERDGVAILGGFEHVEFDDRVAALDWCGDDTHDRGDGWRVVRMGRRPRAPDA